MTEHGGAPKLTLLPAIDVAGGVAVRLTPGSAAIQAGHGDALETAADWVREGADWIHLVDLDAAFGRGHNRAVITSVIECTPPAASIELSGGVCDDVALAAALATGAKRVIVGSAALVNLDWVIHSIAAHGDAIAVGLDVRGSTLAPRGTTQDVGDLWQTLDRLEGAGCSRYVLADVARDGTLEGPNLEMLALVCSRTAVPIIASGGIARLDDIAELRALVPHGLEGAIVGMALYSGGFTLAEALRVASS